MHCERKIYQELGLAWMQQMLIVIKYKRKKVPKSEKPKKGNKKTEQMVASSEGVQNL